VLSGRGPSHGRRPPARRRPHAHLRRRRAGFDPRRLHPVAAHHQRRRAARGALPSEAAHRGRTPAFLSGFTTADRERLDWLGAQLRRLVTTPGLRPRHIPALACLPEEPPFQLSSIGTARANAAIGLYMVVSGLTGGFVAASTACHAFGTPHTETSRLVSGIARGRGITAAHAHLLLSTAEGLIADGLIDYQRRRDLLRDIHTLRWSPHRSLALPAVEGTPGAQLGLGWMWMMLTRGPLYTSNTPTLPTDRVLRFGELIDPETRLVLYEHGMGMLTDPDSDADADLAVALAPAVAGPAVLRGLG